MTDISNTPVDPLIYLPDHCLLTLDTIVSLSFFNRLPQASDPSPQLDILLPLILLSAQLCAISTEINGICRNPYYIHFVQILWGPLLQRISDWFAPAKSIRSLHDWKEIHNAEALQDFIFPSHTILQEKFASSIIASTTRDSLIQGKTKSKDKAPSQKSISDPPDKNSLEKAFSAALKAGIESDLARPALQLVQFILKTSFDILDFFPDQRKLFLSSYLSMDFPEIAIRTWNRSLHHEVTEEIITTFIDDFESIITRFLQALNSIFATTNNISTTAKLNNALFHPFFRLAPSTNTQSQQRDNQTVKSKENKENAKTQAQEEKDDFSNLDQPHFSTNAHYSYASYWLGRNPTPEHSQLFKVGKVSSNDTTCLPSFQSVSALNPICTEYDSQDNIHSATLLPALECYGQILASLQYLYTNHNKTCNLRIRRYDESGNPIIVTLDLKDSFNSILNVFLLRILQLQPDAPQIPYEMEFFEHKFTLFSRLPESSSESLLTSALFSRDILMHCNSFPTDEVLANCITLIRQVANSLLWKNESNMDGNNSGLPDSLKIEETDTSAKLILTKEQLNSIIKAIDFAVTHHSYYYYGKTKLLNLIAKHKLHPEEALFVFLRDFCTFLTKKDNEQAISSVCSSTFHLLVTVALTDGSVHCSNTMKCALSFFKQFNERLQLSSDELATYHHSFSNILSGLYQDMFFLKHTPQTDKTKIQELIDPLKELHSLIERELIELLSLKGIPSLQIEFFKQSGFGHNSSIPPPLVPMESLQLNKLLFRHEYRNPKFEPVTLKETRYIDTRYDENYTIAMNKQRTKEIYHDANPGKGQRKTLETELIPQIAATIPRLQNSQIRDFGINFIPVAFKNHILIRVVAPDELDCCIVHSHPHPLTVVCIRCQHIFISAHPQTIRTECEVGDISKLGDLFKYEDTNINQMNIPSPVKLDVSLFDMHCTNSIFQATLKVYHNHLCTRSQTVQSSSFSDSFLRRRILSRPRQIYMQLSRTPIPTSGSNPTEHDSTLSSTDLYRDSKEYHCSAIANLHAQEYQEIGNMVSQMLRHIDFPSLRIPPHESPSVGIPSTVPFTEVCIRHKVEPTLGTWPRGTPYFPPTKMRWGIETKAVSPQFHLVAINVLLARPNKDVWVVGEYPLTSSLLSTPTNTVSTTPDDVFCCSSSSVDFGTPDYKPGIDHQILFTAEYKQDDSVADTSTLGQVYDYLYTILSSQPWRRFIYGALLTPSFFRLFRLSTLPGNSKMYAFSATNIMHTIYGGMRYWKLFLQQPLWFFGVSSVMEPPSDAPNVFSFVPVQYRSVKIGRTSTVYDFTQYPRWNAESSVQSPNYLIKVYRMEYLLNMLKELVLTLFFLCYQRDESDVGKSDFIIKAILPSSSSLQDYKLLPLSVSLESQQTVLHPLGYPICDIQDLSGKHSHTVLHSITENLMSYKQYFQGELSYDEQMYILERLSSHIQLIKTFLSSSSAQPEYYSKMMGILNSTHHAITSVYRTLKKDSADITNRHQLLSWGALLGYIIRTINTLTAYENCFNDNIPILPFTIESLFPALNSLIRLHQLGVVHRDISLTNVLLRVDASTSTNLKNPYGYYNSSTLIDFGAVVEADSNQSFFGCLSTLSDRLLVQIHDAKREKNSSPPTFKFSYRDDLISFIKVTILPLFVRDVTRIEKKLLSQSMTIDYLSTAINTWKEYCVEWKLRYFNFFHILCLPQLLLGENYSESSHSYYFPSPQNAISNLFPKETVCTIYSTLYGNNSPSKPQAQDISALSRYCYCKPFLDSIPCLKDLIAFSFPDTNFSPSQINTDSCTTSFSPGPTESLYLLYDLLLIEEQSLEDDTHIPQQFASLLNRLLTDALVQLFFNFSEVKHLQNLYATLNKRSSLAHISEFTMYLSALVSMLQNPSEQDNLLKLADSIFRRCNKALVETKLDHKMFDLASFKEEVSQAISSSNESQNSQQNGLKIIQAIINVYEYGIAFLFTQPETKQIEPVSLNWIMKVGGTVSNHYNEEMNQFITTGVTKDDINEIGYNIWRQYRKERSELAAQRQLSFPSARAPLSLNNSRVLQDSCKKEASKHPETLTKNNSYSPNSSLSKQNASYFLFTQKDFQTFTVFISCYYNSSFFFYVSTSFRIESMTTQGNLISSM